MIDDRKTDDLKIDVEQAEMINYRQIINSGQIGIIDSSLQKRREQIINVDAM